MKENQIKQNQNKIKLMNPQKQLQNFMIKSDELACRLEKAIKFMLSKTPEKIDNLKHNLRQCILQKIKESHLDYIKNQKLLNNLNPLEVMKRGFAVARKNNKIIKSSQELNLNDTFQIQFSKGKIQALVKEVL